MRYLAQVILATVLLVVSPLDAQILALPRLDRLAERESLLLSAEDSGKGETRIGAALDSGKIFAVRTEEEGVLFWNHQPTELLVGSRFAFAQEEATLHTEVAAVLSGAWRFGLGTTLSVDATQDDATEDATATAAEDEEVNDAEKAFKTFLIGGGNVSLQAVRPIAIRADTYNAQFLFFAPRAWLNVPTIGVTENVDNGGAEVGAEYQYHRLRTDNRSPFLVFHLRGGLTFGTSKFHESLGRSSHSAFAYLAPALNFVVQDRVKIGVLGFVGPNSFNEMPRFRLNFEVLGAGQQKEDEDASNNDNE
ncbi:hypothetical protein [Longimicrobium sp.]|jgi:hypothetical protein|uniref:hypothetical protein n=1 Tax=Longimicrobium sp. TaxID=2029185 RepID=UPI002F95D330